MHSKQDIQEILDNLKDWVDNHIDDTKGSNALKRCFLSELKGALKEVEMEFSDIFGTEGYQHSIFGED
jgi:hypothetical protein